MSRTRARCARMITEVCSPWIANTVFFLVLGVASGAWVQGVLAAVLTGIVPQAVIIARVRSGKTGDHHVTQGHQRRAVFVMILLCLAVLMGVLALMTTPRLLWVAVLAALAFIVVYLVVTAGFGVKISVHTGLWLCIWAFLAVTVSTWWALGLVLLPVIMWSRYTLREHSLPEISGGFGAGAAILAVSLLLV